MQTFNFTSFFSRLEEDGNLNPKVQLLFVISYMIFAGRARQNL